MSEKITMKVAVYEYTATGDCYGMVGHQYASSHDRQDHSVIRISEWQEIDFIKVPAESIVPEMVKNIDNKIEEIKAEAMARVNELQSKKAELLALSYDQ